MQERGTRRYQGRFAGLICLVCLATLSQGLWAGTAAPSFFIPLIGHGTDNAGNQFSSEINLINLSTTASQVVIKTFNDEGDPLRLLQMDLGSTAPEAVSELTVNLAGSGIGGAQTLSDNAGSQLAVGWAEVSSADAIGVQAIFRIRDMDGNLTTSANVRIGALVTTASFFGGQRTGLNTGIALLNVPGNPAARIAVHAVDSDGTGLLTSFINLGPGERNSENLFEYLPSLGNFNGSIVITSTNLDDPEGEVPFIAVLPLRQEGVVLTTLDLFHPMGQ